MKRNLLPRILISLLGAAFILWGAINATLGIMGESAWAVVTDIRREGGERNDGKAGRYMYNISYVFTLPDGEEISGYTKKIGDGVYLKADGNGRLAVKYFKAIPFLNSPAEDAQNPISQGVRIGIGALLFFLMVKKSGDSNKMV